MWIGSSGSCPATWSRIHSRVLPLSQSRFGRSSTTIRPDVTRRPLRADPCTFADTRGGLRRGVAVVHRDREPLVLHHDSGDVECLGELGRGPLQHRHRRRRVSFS